MNLNAQRPWITPVVIGAFLLSATTGVLMFFHLDSGLNKTAHEWLSWAMVVGVGLHILLNLPAFKRYFTQTTGRVVIALFAAVLAVSFIPAGADQAEPGFAAPIHALAEAPVASVAAVAGVDEATLNQRLVAAGATGEAGQTIAQRVGPDLRAQIRVLTQVLQPAPQ
ncbi:MAG: DUF4405 domain-containing protein [Hydrogenophaga sp.]|uniref:DUF4405 domain-containing protein n=1 Tax=Hydrogenophaga sp. TaxID=1904254 RepID=UPI001D9B8E05|nr:DUF4405 domain-containing protein [Hydrogenophaga sp.]MBX3609771.1 DUF4405 domain-containing protein [Hydrogenophaga sp.]